MMSRNHLWASALSVLALGAPVAAHAVGVAAGSTIHNAATVEYNLDGSEDTFSDQITGDVLVDRKVIFTVTSDQPLGMGVIKGGHDAVLPFTIHNDSNAPLDFGFEAIQLPSGDPTTFAAPAVDGIDMDNVRIYADDGNNTFGPEDQALAFADEVPADATRKVYMVADMPASVDANGVPVQSQVSIAGMVLKATAFDGETEGSKGEQATEIFGGNTEGVDTVLADEQGSTGTNHYNDLKRDGAYTAWSAYLASGVDIKLYRAYKVLSDPINDTNEPKAIPGSTLMYCIMAVATGDFTHTIKAKNVKVTDLLTDQDGNPLPAGYSLASSVYVGSTITGSYLGNGFCNQNGSATGTFDSASNTVTATLPDMQDGDVKGIWYKLVLPPAPSSGPGG